jgi:hypothetical protein
MKESPKLSWVSAVSWIVGSALIVSIVSHKVIRYTLSNKKKNAPIEKVEYLIQTGPFKEALRSDYLMELLSLSSDVPAAFDSLDLSGAQKKLLKSPVIQEVFVKKIKPNMLYVDYTVRTPTAWVSDFVNTALDKEGVIFPVHPFFSPKRLPEIYLGESGLKDCSKVSLGQPLSGKYLDVAFSLMTFLEEKNKDLFFLKRIDVSEAFSTNLGKREIVVIVENELYFPGQEKVSISTHFLRLSLKNYEEEIVNYLNLREHLLEAEKQEASFTSAGSSKEKIIDLRLPQLAYIQ